MNDALVAVPPLTVSVSVNTGVLVQLAVPLGPYKLKVIGPVGSSPPVRVAVSLTAAPTVPPALGLVVMAGAAWLMATCSAPQLVAAWLLLVSPP